MIAIDTNILLRYLRNDDVSQSAAARRLIDEQATIDQPLSVGPEVLSEIYWFAARKLRKSREEIVQVLLSVLDHRNLLVVHASYVEAAVDAFAQGPASFVDYLIAAMAQARGADFTFTFDRDAAKHASFRLLSSGD